MTTDSVDPPGTASAADTATGANPMPTTAASTMSTADGDDGYEDDDGGTGCTFTCPNPLPPATTGGGGSECDIVAQDCPRGEKCMPWANDGGGNWNATRCSPIDDNPGDPGDPCQVEGSGTSGIDDCALGVVCWLVDPKTNQGTCTAVCDALQGVGTCPGNLGCTQVDDVPLCIDGCDPIAPDCPEGQGCFLAGSSFACSSAPPKPVPLGEACSGLSSSCAPGQLCAYGAAFDCGRPGEGCCAGVCDLTDPNGCAAFGGMCTPWFPVAPPPELANLGVCTPA
ncbi:MAG: hypothetical protein K0V04_29405 [Deltaproteobacteria bacterium]|nr:hypothetical protein [Deltaproteobacteria bacterium]